jgi:predicted DNA-binding protein
MVNQTTVQKKASTSLNLNVELYKEAKIEAIREGKTVSELVEEAIEAWIRERKKRA